MKILILGGGISGLSAAWYIQRQDPSAEITLLEKENRLGGWIETGPFQFEKGPRTFLTSRSPSLLSLIEEMGLGEEILYSDPRAERRFLWNRGKLRSLGSFWPLLLPSLFLEPFRRQGADEDESIYDFAKRRFSANVAETLFDPLALGIFAGDIRSLSLRSCFPSLHAMEQEQGSLLLAWLKKKREKRQKGLFTLKRGMGSLIEALEKNLRIAFVRGARVESISPRGVFAKSKFWPADRIISALPGSTLGQLTGLWPDFPTASLWVVNAAFQQNIFPQQGFGYLVPTRENEPLLGMIWDSAIFPGQNREGLCRLTAMIRPWGDAEWAETTLSDALKRHLGSAAAPLFVQTQEAHGAIPQFKLGYEKRLALFRNKLAEKFPSLTPIGNYLGSPSVEACIALSRTVLDVS